MRIGEVTAHTGSLLDLPVTVELSAVVPCNRLEGQPALADEFQHGTVHCRHCTVCKLDDQGRAGAAVGRGQLRRVDAWVEGDEQGGILAAGVPGRAE